MMIYENTGPAPGSWQPPMVVLAGMGMGRRDLSTHTLEWIERAEVLIGGMRHLESFPEHAGRRILLKTPLEKALDEIDRVSRDERTLVLASGDPLFYGIGQRLIRRLGKQRVLVFPNITTVQALFSRLGESWANVKVFTLHGREGAAENHLWLREARHYEKVVLFTDPWNTPSLIAAQLLDAGITERQLVVAENLGLPSESIGRFSLEEAVKRDFSPLNLVLVDSGTSIEEEPGDPLEWPVMGIPEDAFQHRAGLITKSEIRSVVIAQLQLKPDLVMWDIGAGSGSVSIEATRITRLRQVVAVEKNADRYLDLVENIRRFQCSEVLPVHGNATRILPNIPDPDRVFIGGSGGDLESILTEVVKRLRPKGRIVQTIVTLDNLDSVRYFWRGKPFDTSIVQLQVNRSVPIGKTIRFDALNPVFVITNSAL